MIIKEYTRRCIELCSALFPVKNFSVVLCVYFSASSVVNVFLTHRLQIQILMVHIQTIQAKNSSVVLCVYFSVSSVVNVFL